MESSNSTSIVVWLPNEEGDLATHAIALQIAGDSVLSRNSGYTTSYFIREYVAIPKESYDATIRELVN